MVWALLVGLGWGGDLGWSGLLAAEWSRDADALLVATVSDADLPVYVRALGRLRDERACERLTLLGRAGERTLRLATAEALAWTPGCVGTLRSRLDAEGDPQVRALLWLALGQAGEAGDVDRAIAALAGPEAAHAAQALGRMGQRGVDGVARAAPALLASLRPWRPEVVRYASFALRRTRGAVLSRIERDELARVWPTLGDEVAQAWLVPVLLPLLEDSDRHAFVRAALAGPSRLVKVAVIGSAEPGELGDLRRLGAEADPWVALRAADRLRELEPPAPVGGGVEALRTALSAGAALPVVERWLEQEALSEAELSLLAGHEDFAVRELVAGWLGEHPAPGAPFVSLLAAAGPDSTWVTVLEGALSARWTPDAPSRQVVRGLAQQGPFLVRDRAIELLAAWGEVVPRVAVAPGPPELERDPTRLQALLAVDVVTTDGTFRVALDPGTAPLAVSAFTWLAEQGRLDGTPFHRVVPGFVVQTGDPRGDGYGGPEWLLPDEVSALPFSAGSVGMARSGRDTGGSQWFVTTSPQPHLVGDYTRFGEVVDGLDLVRRLDTSDRVLDVVVVRR